MPPSTTATATPAGATAEAAGREEVGPAKRFLCGLVAGAVQAGLLNPWDRALYLAVLKRRPFMRLQNFIHPYRGFNQTIFHKALSGSLYLPLEETFMATIRRHTAEGAAPGQPSPVKTWQATAAGLLAGAMNGLLLNPLASVKYTYWGSPDHPSFVETTKTMWRNGGMGVFTKGAWDTVARDLVFGGVFSSLRHAWLAHLLAVSATSAARNGGRDPGPSAGALIVGNGMAAAVATIASAPMNYVRNVKYGTGVHEDVRSTRSILSHLFRKGTRIMAEDGLREGFKYLQTRLLLGWGSGRVAVGMGISAWLYSTCTGRTS